MRDMKRAKLPYGAKFWDQEDLFSLIKLILYSAIQLIKKLH